MKSAAIVTLPGMFNYGNMLQKYAVQSLLKKAGAIPVTFEFRDRSVVSRLKNTYYKLTGKWIPSPESLMSDERRTRFKMFAELISLETVTKANDPALAGFDVYFVGSDQVWNPNYIDSFQSAFLPFAPKGRRMALSASFGVEDIPADRVGIFRDAINNFSRISVREEAGRRLVERLTGRDVPVLADPTLAVPRKEWLSLANDGLVPAQPYVFAYVLGSSGEQASIVVDSISSSYDAEAISLSDRDSSKQLPAGPAEFLGLIASAEHVITDSFHCALFSALFKRPLTILRRSEQSSSFSRIETLVEKLGIEQAVFNGDFNSIDSRIDYADIDTAIEYERMRLSEYLEACLSV